MELVEAVTTAVTTRAFQPTPVDDDVLLRALELARFAPTGGNRQPVRFIIVRNAATRSALKRLYLDAWSAGLRQLASGTVDVKADHRQSHAAITIKAQTMAEHLDDIPVHVVVCAELTSLAITDAETGRPSVVGGASIYPAVQNLLLGCRSQGLGAALTTVLCRREAEVVRLLGIPDGWVTAALVAVGWPAGPFPKTLSRRPLSELAFGETFGTPLTPRPNP
jgi:nitroreductase